MERASLAESAALGAVLAAYQSGGGIQIPGPWSFAVTFALLPSLHRIRRLTPARARDLIHQGFRQI